MVQLDAAQRPTISEIINHPWMKGELPDHQEVIVEFKKRMKTVRQKNEEQKQAEKRMAKQNGPMRGPGDENTYISPQKQLVEYIDTLQTGTQFITDMHPDQVESALLSYLKGQDVKVSVNDKKYKLKFTLCSYDLDKNEYKNEICIKLLKVKDTNQICIEF